MTLQNIKDYRERGFTIVELLIVIVVIAILATLVITAYNGVQQRARDSKRDSDVRAIQTAAEAYQSEKSLYPTLTQLEAADNTVKLDSSLTDKITGTPPTDATKDNYGYIQCTHTTKGVTGAQITYWKETGTTTGLHKKNLGDLSSTNCTP
ncbi:MAG TPA: type II secretion system protein [Verrucomicrobiae bacterium]|nr:type II secretion system protein [Verrucomicrobiae bacterium]